MVKINKEPDNPGVGGTFLFDPKTGKSTLVPETEPTTTDNGSTNKEVLADSQD